ncbi:hypothetical protein [Actinoplanes sp. NBRC 103695]|uniref:alpha/beta fold hydrolase n=1 Tax=Actinoplanes sp. NBRC 103695 TaxID=3032202 RepID=UPI0025530396|nr:hypothetical protein [Actinoplanes sp. NBRC 103695]
MIDPTLAERLGAVDAPALVAWSEVDRLADAAAIPGAEFTLLPETGHLLRPRGPRP